MFYFISLKKHSKSITAVVVAVIILMALPFIKRIFPDLSLAVETSIQSTDEDKGIFLPVIMYHSVLIEPTRQGDYVVTPSILENDLKWLKENGYKTVLTDDLVDYIENDKPLPEKPIMITFDDGFYNNMKYALPLLEKYGMSGIISVVGEYSTALTSDVGRLQSELRKKSSVTPKIFAYPYGYVSRESIPILRELGFKATLN